MTAPSSYFSQLKRASWRGVPFQTTGGQAKFGRRTALHEYPFRDAPWVEDLGRGTRRIQLSGFIVGDDVIAQRDALIAACEKPGFGDLVHPTFGKIRANLQGDFSVEERFETGRVFEFNFTFIETGAGREFPSTSVSSVDAVASCTKALTSAAGAQWTQTMKGQLVALAPVPAVVSDLSSSWARDATSAVASATNTMNLTASASGNFGRLLSQSSGISLNASLNAPGVTLSVAGLFGAAAARRTSVAISGAALLQAAGVLTASTLPAFSVLAGAFAVAVRGAAFTPADALFCARRMSQVQGVGSLCSTATADYLRRLGVAQLCISSSLYQPSTAAEAVAVRNQVTASLDAEIQTAGSQGDDAAYAALKALRAQVVLDLNQKGARLPTLVEVTSPSSVPSLVIAQRLYQNVSREPELVRRAAPAHPAFMPTKFEALSS